MFLKPYEQRMALWHEFRKHLESADDPLQEVIDFYKHAPSVTINCDPWDRNTWPGPWELLKENLYCNYCIILAMCYTLQLTDKFKNRDFEIHISIDRQTRDRYYYLLRVDNRIVGYRDHTHIDIKDLPSTLYSETIHSMPALS